MSKMWGRTALLVASIVVVVSALYDTKPNEPIVAVKQGKLRGSIRNLLDGTPYYSFQGVPYAQPPVGEFRFQAPRPPVNWSGIRNATEHGPNCPQFDANVNQYVEGSEDCLHLNVYTKSITSKTPVMVYIHGGGWMSGSGDNDTYGPEFLFQHDVILVTMNYRLEVLGFLSLDIPEAPGNAGIKDQVAALRWLKENIAKFGGDPNNITIFGESAGSAAVTFHLISPMSKGLFNKAIAQSGVNIVDWSNTSDARERAFRIGKVLGKETDDVYELLRFLRSLPAIKLTKLTMKSRTADERYRGLPVHFLPVVEKKFKNVEAFIDEKPINYLLQNRVNAVPLILGYNSAEGLLLIHDQLNKTKVYNAQPSYYIPRELYERVSENKLKEMGERVKRFYAKDKEFSNDTAEGIVDLQTDLHFAFSTHRFAHLYSKLNIPVYMYRFDYETDLNILKTFLNVPEFKGACHADDLWYLFYNPLNKDIYKEQEKLHPIVYNLTKLWADFAITGNPTPKTHTWQQYTQSGKEYLALNEVMTAGKYADKERMEFWNKLYREAGVPYITKANL